MRAPPVWLSPRGVWVLLGFAVGLALAGVVPYAGYALALAAFAALGLLAVDVRLGPRRETLRVARRPIEHLALRRSANAVYDLENRSGIAVRIGLYESPVPTLEFDPAALVAELPPRSATTLELELVPRERGAVELGDLYAWSTNRIGLLRRRHRFPALATARVLSNLDGFGRYGTLARRTTLIDAGLRKLRLRGTGTEFESLREYQSGDAFRSVDWKATARSGRLMVAQHEVERSQTIVIALDCGRLMTPRIGPQRKFEYALEAALSIARIAAEAGDNVGLEAFAERPILSIAARRGVDAATSLVRATYELQPRFEEPDYETVFVRLRRRYSKRSLVVLFTDIFDPVTSSSVLAGLSSLSPRHLAMCVLMNDAAIESALEREPLDESEAYRTSVAMTLADERARAIAVMRSRGAIVVDVPAPRLTTALLDAYLEVKARGRL